MADILIDYVGNFGKHFVDVGARAWTKRCLLDLFGVMLAASSPRYSASGILEEFVRREGGHPVASIVGRPIRTAPSLAALVNGTLAYYCDIEPHHTETIMHAAAVAVPAVLATAEAQGANGQEFLIAAILGVDIACRMSAGLDPKGLYARGFHPTSVAGVFGAMAGSGYLLQLNQQQWRNGLGLAALQASGLLAWASDHTEHSRPLNPGLAARNGVTAATLASLGFGGPPDWLEGKFDVFKAFSGVNHADRITDGLGTRLLVTELAIKQYACCAFLHPGLDALLSLMTENSIAIRDIERIDLRFARAGASIIDNNQLKSHNAQYILPVAALQGRVTIDDILTDRLADPETARLSRNIRVIYDEELDKVYPGQYSSVVLLYTRDGKVLQRRVDWPKGHPRNPLSDKELMDKYMMMATQRCTADQAERIAELVMNIEEVEDVRILGRALSLSNV